MRRRVLCGLVVLLSATALWASGNSEGSGVGGVSVNKNGFPIVSEPITLSAVARMSNWNVPFEDLELLADYEAETGITVEWTSIAGSDWTERMNLLLATAEFPDFVYGSLPGNVAELGTEGIITPLNEYLEDYAPNMMALFDRHPIVKAVSTYPDGNVYSFPAYDSRPYHGQIPVKLFINHGWLATLGLDEPTTPEEFYDVLVAFKTQDPNGNGRADEIPLAFWTAGGGSLADWTAFFGPWGVVNTLMVEDGEVSWGFLDEGFREATKYYQRLYEEGLLDLESITQTQNQVSSKSYNTDGEAIIGATHSLATWFVLNNPDEVLMFNGGFGTVRTVDDLTTNPNFVYDILMPLRGPEGDQLVRRSTSGIYRDRGFIFAQTEHPEAIVRWFDTWLDGGERSYETRLGKLGVTIYNDDGIIMRNPTPEGLNANEWQHQIAPGHISVYNIDTDLLPMAIQPHVYMMTVMTDRLMPYTPDEYWPQDYVLGTPDEEAFIAQYEEELLTYVFETMGRFIAGGANIDQEWDGFVQQVNRMQAPRLLEIRQAQYDRLQNSLPAN